MEKEKIGFIGLGIMGRPMSKNILKAGHPLIVYTRKKEKIEEMIKLGAKGANSPKEVAENSDIVITMLPDSYEVEEVILGEKGVIEGIKPDSIVIDMSSIDPKTTVKIGYA
ncbi:MAG: NAD(P)-binding domain-containing protein, partial [Dictyoglomaceae bacterium]|nr:NAD(P)-binding domain-containing protein [Dictyoglomaceae bacterium]